ncbi:MAG: metalloregulator ArsR/SmtB family transcription factor [Chloroflexi bacterium]|nr:metalloregulator ArsR/SmtB family transcription factor [Chloroflexota bacterium]
MDVPATAHAAEVELSPETLAALQAVAEPTRARILALLGHGEHCVCDVGTVLGLSTALVSHHLRVLRTSRLLRERRSGRWVFYSLDLDGLTRVRSVLDTLLTPGDAAAASCLCSDCGQSRPVRPVPGTSPLARLPALSETPR